MDMKEYVDSLFLEYENDEALEDFKEELLTNLADRIDNLRGKGMDEQAAFAKATAELGDVSALAGEIGRKKKREVLEHVYMKTTNYMSMPRILAYVVCGAVLAFGIVAALLAWLHTRNAASGIGALLPLCTLPLSVFVFLGLTQETAATEPMPWKRALVYALDAELLMFGIIASVLTYLTHELGLKGAIATLLPFVLPGTALLAFLLLTEKNRSKPWVAALQREWAKQDLMRFENPVLAKRYGLLSGALWTFAAAVFIVTTFLAGLKISWVVFVFAAAFQMLVEFSFCSE